MEDRFRRKGLWCSLRDPFLAIEANGVLQREYDDHQCHARESDGSADIEQAVASAENVHHRLPEQGQVSNRQQNAQFGWAEAPERDAKLAEGVRRQIRLDREHQKSDEPPDGDPGM